MKRHYLPPVKLLRTLLPAALCWTAAISGLHYWFSRPELHPGEATEQSSHRYGLAYLPVTCHLTCPVTDYISKSLNGQGFFDPVRFSGWPELKESFLSGHTPAAFVLAPMAIALREDGVPLKMVYLGHRDGTAMMVRTDSDIHSIEDLRGKKIAVPNRFANQRLLVYKALQDHGLSVDDVTLVELAPPDMPVALYSGAVDAVTSGEPFMAQTELDGYGRVLYLTKDVWPDFISCVLVVQEDLIRNDRAAVQQLVDGIARSGKWLDESMDNRLDAAKFVARDYYNQDPELLSFVLSKPPDRVRYTHLALVKSQFEEIEVLAKQAGIIKGTARFEDYADLSFVPDEEAVKAYDFDGSQPEATP